MTSSDQQQLCESEQQPQRSTPFEKYRRSLRRVWLATGALSVLALVAIQPAAAQVGSDFCTTDMASTIKNVFSVIQFGGPLIGGTLFLGATVATPTIRRADVKKELKELRTQALIWGVIVAPLATAILQFVLNNVVAGGASCGF
jgi:hypothetical protein